MRDLIGQIREALQNPRLYYLTLFASLALPDICGAISSDNGEASGQKYIDWYNKYVADSCPFLTGEDCYRFRCSLLHQGSTQHPKGKYSRIVFVEPSATTNVFHCNILNDALNLDVRVFCTDMIQGVENWLQENENTELYKKNYNRFIRRYPNGLRPYIGGVPVIS
jgi:hypothetical protein